ncbi:hypothetical protein AB0J35_62410 [Nonomuraea angiospora]|uniref:hypothetical protein n=1 Tax=Nonomuraea angiospora TaxID=46172 RepID=UPI003416AD23
MILQIGGQEVGATSRQRIEQLAGRRLRSIGDGDGASLPGESASYEFLRFRCGTCGRRVRRIHIDERDLPRCPQGHGVLERES